MHISLYLFIKEIIYSTQNTKDLKEDFCTFLIKYILYKYKTKYVVLVIDNK